MNKTKIILRLQQLASTSSDPYELMLLAKAAEKLKAGSVSVVSTTASLPAAATSTVGEIFLVENDDDLYVNVGSQWNSLNSELLGVPYTWGSNASGRLGDGTTTNRSSPVDVVGGISWVQLLAAGEHTIGVTSNGTAYTWGSNSIGQLGDGTNTFASKSSPVTVVGGINWSRLAANYNQSFGIASDGSAYGWGNNSFGQLGDNSISARSSPVSVVGGFTWSQISAGWHHTLGVTTAGVAYAWGRNTYGALGDGTTTSRRSPVTVVGGITNWSQVSGGEFHSLGLTSTGIAYAWGRNSTHGQLGDETTVNKSSPVTVVGGITNWSQLVTRNSHNLAITSAGIAYGWGYNAKGQIGDGTSVNKSSPVTVVGGITNWAQLSASGHSLGITSDGIAYYWGRDTVGQVGNGTTSNTSTSSPATIVGGITNWIQISAGANHSAGLNGILKSI